MQFKFDANQSYQLDAVRSVVELFEGQPDTSQNEFSLSLDDVAGLGMTQLGIANKLLISTQQLLENCQKVQSENRLPLSESLEWMKLSNGRTIGNFPNFTVEMETGTGKTYVYLRIIHELHKTFGFKKFVIVVPSVAIREGVLKSLDMTKEHFQTLYDFERVEFSTYDSARVNQLRNFSISDAIQILVINIDAFAKDSAESSDDTGSQADGKKKNKGNVINQIRETGIRPIEFIQAACPIVLLDEPQNLETDTRKQAIARLSPLCTLRFSATHKNTYNLVYQLDPVRAYELGLVKQISVDSVIKASDPNQAYVEVEDFRQNRRFVSAKIRFWQNQAGGPTKKSKVIRTGTDLFDLSNEREIYKDGFIVNEIDAGEQVIRFANDVSVHLGRPNGAFTDQILRLQIEATIRRHFEKELKLRKQGIKVLSVFFIDRVANYREYSVEGTATKGKFAIWFEEIFDQYRKHAEYEGLYEFEGSQVHNGYFAQDKRLITPFVESSQKSNADAEAGAFELIMRDKERLLDEKEPLRFIFSHSALREGWDSPNVFQICTLAESTSEIKKRQEIGRGMRLCVNRTGERVFDRSLNRLTVIANESYEDFANQLQREMAEAGVAFKREMVKNEREKITIKLRKGYEADNRFLELWNRIKYQTRYSVKYDTSELIKKASIRVKEKTPPIKRPVIEITRTDLAITKEGISGTQTGLRTQTVEGNYLIPDLVGQIQNKTGLSRSTVAKILLESGRLGDAINNPQSFVDYAIEAINAIKRELIVDGVEYLKIDGQTYEMRRFQGDDLMEVFESNVHAVNNTEKTLFSHIIIDSGSSPEFKFAEACDSNEDVLFYIKLPRWFRIDTPVGSYNPDWAVAYRNDQVLYFVAETKDTGRRTGIAVELLRPIEQLKIECGSRHFKNFENVQFKVVNSLQDLISN
jgi:type III restriction enzyme